MFDADSELHVADVPDEFVSKTELDAPGFILAIVIALS